MRMPSSKPGLVLLGLYLIFAGYAVVSAFTCDGFLCPLIIVAPALPWFYFWMPIVDASGSLQLYLGLTFLAGSYVLNGWILYQLGRLLGRLLFFKPFR
jgi:hypothetical protein